MDGWICNYGRTFSHFGHFNVKESSYLEIWMTSNPYFKVMILFNVK